MKKNILLFLLITISLGCKKEPNEMKNNLASSSELKDSTAKDTVIENISKNCEEMQTRNINEYYLCEKWKVLNENQIKKIIRLGEIGDGGEEDSRTLHFTTSELPIWTTADMIIGNHRYKLKINGGSYFYLTNDKNKTTLYFCKNEELRTFFLSSIGTEDDERYDELKIKNRNQVKLLKTNLSSWQGDYNFDNGNYEQGYKNYHIKIEKNNCIFYQGELPACEIECIAEQKDNELFLYLKSNEFKKSKYDISLLESLEEGDYLLKIFKDKNKYFINSKLIKHWDDNKEKFNKNVNIEAVRK